MKGIQLQRSLFYSCVLFFGLLAWPITQTYGAANMSSISDSETSAKSTETKTSYRNIVLCLDGTWNGTYNEERREDGSPIIKPTNVLKTARAIRPVSTAGVSQLVYYDSGIGSLSKYPGVSNTLLSASDKYLGGAWGAGFESNVEDALTFIANNYQPADQVYIFGFSRGASTARAVTQFLDWAQGLPPKRDAYYIPRLFREFIEHKGEKSVDDVVAAINHERPPLRGKPNPLNPFVNVEVRYLGVWDTVMALGSRFRSTKDDSTSTVSKSFYIKPMPAAVVKTARQALAIDEQRYDFRPEIWQAAGPNQIMEQRWFAGVHSNIGGGYPEDGLANITFKWILQGAVEANLDVSGSFRAFYPAYAQDKLYKSRSFGSTLSDVVRLRYGKGRRSLINQPQSANLSLDKTVIHRILQDPLEKDAKGNIRHKDFGKKKYRPANVIQFLACVDDLEKYLAGIGLTDPKYTTLPEDVTAMIRDMRSEC